MTADEPDSPCCGVCLLDRERGWCAGCFRTPREIQEWPAASAPRKQEILEQIEERERESNK